MKKSERSPSNRDKRRVHGRETTTKLADENHATRRVCEQQYVRRDVDALRDNEDGDDDNDDDDNDKRRRRRRRRRGQRNRFCHFHTQRLLYRT